jgi:signal transduction histidine kinase
VADNAFATGDLLVRAVLDTSGAELGWLAWLDSSAPVVLRGRAPSSIEPTDISDFPDPPAEPLVITNDSAPGLWALWCAARGIHSAVVVPVLVQGRVVGTMGLASSTSNGRGHNDVRQLTLVSSLAVSARTYAARLAGQRRLFAEVSRSLENALALDRALQQPPTYREIARAVGASLDATYCLIAIQDSRGALTLRATGGRRPTQAQGVTSWHIRRLPGCARALRERHAVVLAFDRHDPAVAVERWALFSPTTQIGVILPFFAGPRTQGVLIIGEERGSRRQPMSPERIAILELVASRIAHILRISRRLEYERLAERRRQRQLANERERLAREVNDGVGEALSGLLEQIRAAVADGQAGPRHLKVLEQAACQAVDGARTLAFGIRHLERGVATLEEARSYAETMLRSIHCRLAWTEERTDLRVARRVVREIAYAITESISNVVQNATADLVRVRVEYPDGHIRVTIRDNGAGLSRRPARWESPERLARVGATFEVRRTPNGKGSLTLIEARRT